jgi:iron complex outermembrane receptor protein
MKHSLLFKHSILFLLLVSAVGLSAQQIQLSGVVLQENDHRPVAGCTIILLGSRQHTMTDKNGRFTLSLPEKQVTGKIVCTYLGYKPDTLSVSNSQSFYTARLSADESLLSEVTVTGVSRATLSRENPVPLISVSSKKIDQSSESNIIDVLVRNVPGLNAVKTGPNISKPLIRGLGYNRVLTLYDGIRQEGQQWGDEHGIEVDAYSIERAEVIKGPASLMYGSDALAGVVSLMPAIPALTDGQLHGKILSEYQGNNSLTGNGLQLFYANNHWAFAGRGSYRIAKNYKNAVDGRVYNTGFRETNVSGSLRYNNGNTGYSTLNLTLYDNLQGIPDGSRDSLSRKFTSQVYEGVLDDIKNRPVVSDAALNSFGLSPLHQRIQHYRLYSNHHYEIGSGDIDFLVAFQQNIRREYDHPTLTDQAGMFVRLNTLNYGVKYNAPRVLNTEFTFGLNGMYQNNLNKDATDFPIPDYSLFDAGAYIFAKWKYGNWTVGTGIRYDIRYLRGDDFYTGANPLTGFGRQVSPDQPGAYLQFPSFDKTFNGTSLSFGTTYQVNQQVSLKANIARGYRAPSITEFASNGLDPGAHIIYLGNRSFRPEFSLQEDIGAEIATRDIAVTFSLFNNHIDHYIYLAQLTDAGGNPIVNAQGDRTYEYQQSSAQLYGAESTFSLHPAAIKGFSFDNNFSVIYGYNRKAVYKGSKTDGEYLPLIPPLRLLSSISQDIKFGQGILQPLSLKAEAEFNAAQNRYLGLNATETATPAYLLVNFSAAAKLRYTKGHELQIQLQINNVFDRVYQSNLSRLKYFEYYSSSPNGHTGIYSMGRNTGLRVIYSF